MDYSCFINLEEELWKNKDKVDKALNIGDFPSAIEFMDEGDFILLRGVIRDNRLILELEEESNNKQTLEEYREFQKLIDSRKRLNEERISAFLASYNFQNKYGFTNLAGNNSSHIQPESHYNYPFNLVSCFAKTFKN
jgi:hypothetical protein